MAKLRGLYPWGWMRGFPMSPDEIRKRLHPSYQAALRTWTIWDWIAAEACARVTQHRLGIKPPSQAARSMALGAWMAMRNK